MVRKTVSLTLAWMFLISSISGIMLYLSPPGRVAYWSDWSLLGFTKSQWDHIHTVTTLLMIIAVGLHLYYNWKHFISYMKDKATNTLAATTELLVSLFVTLLIAVGALTEVAPFSFIIDIGDYISEEWEVAYGTPPYNHAELDTLEVFCKKLDINFESSKEQLVQNHISFKEKDSLLDIATKNKISPQKIFKIISPEDKSNKSSSLHGSGLGKKTLSQVCVIRGLNLNEVLKKLKDKDISANSDEKFKNIAEKYEINPMKLLEIIEKE